MGYKGAATITKAPDSSQPYNSKTRFFLNWIGLDSEFFRQPNFRFVVYFLKTTETGKGKPVDGNRADFADGRIVYRRSTAFSMNQDKHIALLPLH